jgi:hypothetical protein
VGLGGKYNRTADTVINRFPVYHFNDRGLSSTCFSENGNNAFQKFQWIRLYQTARMKLLLLYVIRDCFLADSLENDPFFTRVVARALRHSLMSHLAEDVFERGGGSVDGGLRLGGGMRRLSGGTERVEEDITDG